MIIDPQKVREACLAIAPKYQFDPLLVYAVCLQESDKDKSGNFDPSMARLEQGFYSRYIAKQNDYATSTEILLSSSWGVMQMMGESLYELGYFGWYFEQCNPYLRGILKVPMSQYAVPSALDAFVVNVEWMVEWGCKWLVKKRDLAQGDTEKMLLLWNGGSAPDYPTQVIARYNKLKG